MNIERRIGSSSKTILYAGTWDDGDIECISIYIKTGKDHDHHLAYHTSSIYIFAKAWELFNNSQQFVLNDVNLLNRLIDNDEESDSVYPMQDAKFTDRVLRLTLEQNGSLVKY